MTEVAGPNYLSMKDHELIAACGDDGAAWAAAFVQTAENLGIRGIDEGWMIGWFANAIETAWNKRVARAEPETRPVTGETCVHRASMDMTCPHCANAR